MIKPPSTPSVTRRSLCAGLAACGTLPAWGQFRVEITGVGATQLPVAIAAFRDEDKSGQPIAAIVRADLERSGQFRNLDVTAAYDERSMPSMSEWRRVGMDEINAAPERQRSARLAETAAARELVDQALSGLRCRLAERMLAPVVARLNRRYRETALEGVERLVARSGLALDPAGREALDRWAETLARRFAHLPTLGLCGLATEQGMLAVRSFLAAADQDLFGELTQGADEIDALLGPAERGLGA